jgi:predicted RNA polymerase sigma factor
MEAQPMPQRDAEIEDERLRLIFTCCHPAPPAALPSPGDR